MLQEEFTVDFVNMSAFDAQPGHVCNDSCIKISQSIQNV